MLERVKQTGFASKFGVIMAAAGSAVGLGNIWKFPYVVGENGGGAFLLVYLICTVIFGIPLLMTEFLIGKQSGKGAIGAFEAISGNKRWNWIGWWSAATVFIFMGFYFVVTGWCADYLWATITNSFADLDSAGLSAHFDHMLSSVGEMLGFGALAVVLTGAVLWFGVQSGVERLSKILMPLLLIIMTIMAVSMLTTEGSMEGVRFLFHPDFSCITPRVVMMAAGQCFFSLSVGAGLLITYGSYMPKMQDVTMTSVQVVILDTLVALLAGLIIFPAVFAFGFSPQEGPELVFVVLPAVFQKMALAQLSGVVFFFLLLIAALTSTISIMEVAVVCLREATNNRLSRRQCVLIAMAASMTLVTLCVLSMTGAWSNLRVFGYDLFDLSDKLVTTIMLPGGAMFISLFVGWFMPMRSKEVVPHSQKRFKQVLRPVFIFALRWLVPIAILLIFLNGLNIIHVQ